MDQRAPQRYSGHYGQPADDSMWARVIKPNIAVFAIIAACVIVFMFELADYEATAPLWMFPTYPMPWMFVTSIFLHGGFEHLFFNMLMLFMFGMTLERMIGSTRFVFLFLLAGIVGNVGYVLFCLATGSDVPAIGASGAIYGIFACLAILAPDIKVYLFFFIPLKIIHALLLYAVVDILFMGANDSIAHAAHIAGLVVGLAFALYIKKKYLERQGYRVSYSFDSGL